jgi:photosystem II stability/assembly factor-like uncharacterized protein
MKTILTIHFALFVNFIFCQQFITQKTGEKATFKKMQLDFNAWKKTSNLKTIKGWKYFKRWENEMQMHCNANGEPAEEKDYIKACVDYAKSKELYSMSKMNSGVWSPAGPYNFPGNLATYATNGMGRINCITFEPGSSTTYYVGVAQGGVWKTADNGNTYTPLTDNLPITRISDICIDPSNTNTIYISVCDFEYIGFGLYLNGRKRNTHYGLGVYKTTDGGTTWIPTGLSFQLTNGDASLIRKILVDPTNSNKVVACGVSGMYKSQDAGTTWTKVLDSLMWDLQQDPVFPNTLYAASGWVLNSNTGAAAIYKSVDFGSSWTMLNTGIPLTDTVQRVKLAIASSDPSTIYAAATDVYGGLHGIYKTTDAGANWNLQYNALNLLEWDEGNNSGGQGNYDLGLLVNPTDKNILYIGGVNMWSSNDGAATFDPVGHWTTSYGPSLHADIHFITQQPLTGYYYVACDGGLWRTSTITPQTWNDALSGNLWPTQWTQVNDGMQISSFYRISSSKTSTGEIIAGAQDNSSLYFDGTNWNSIIGGDGMDNYIDTAFMGSLIGSSQYGNFEQSFDGGMNTFWINPNVNGEYGEWTTPLTADYKNYGSLYCGFGNVVKSEDNGTSWSFISSFAFDPQYQNEISALAVSPANANYVYAARRVRYEYSIPGSLWKTTDGGGTWTDITAGLPDSLYYTSTDAGENNPDELYVSMAGLQNGTKVFKTTDGGVTWTNISFNLPNIPVNCVKVIPGTNDVMAATDIGVWVYSNASTTWVNQSGGLPNVIVSDIEFNRAANKIYICTFGRGIWATDMDVFLSVKKEAESASLFSLYPTANYGNFHIGIPKNKNISGEKVTVEIVDVKGRSVWFETYSSQNEISIQFQGATGLYFAKIQCGRNYEVKKFIVQ